MNYNLIDIPQYIHEDIYQTYIEKYIQNAKQVKGVIAIYQMGSISTPGISDIDIIVVVDGKFNPYEYQKLSAKGLFREDKIANYLFIHDVVVIDVKSFENIEYIAYYSNLKLLYGEEIYINKVSEETKKILGFAISVDFLISRLHQFKYLVRKNIFPIRGNIVRASSLKHTATLIGELGLKFDTNILEKTKEIRNTWFETKDEGSVIKYFHESINFFNSAAFNFNRYFENEILIYNEKNYNKKLKILNDFNRITIFSSPSKIEDTNNHSVEDNHYMLLNELEQDGTILLYPDKLFFHYSTYSKFNNNDVSNKINYLLLNNDINFGVHEFYEEVMMKRCEAISYSIKFIKENRIYFSNSNGYPGFNMLS